MLLIEIVPIRTVQVMLTFRSHFFKWFKIRYWTYAFLYEVLKVSCLRTKFITLRIVYFRRRIHQLRLRPLRVKWLFVGCRSHKWLKIRIELFIFVSQFILLNTFRLIGWFIPWLPSKFSLGVLVFNPGYNFLSHSRFMPRKVFTVGRIEIVVRLVGIFGI